MVFPIIVIKENDNMIYFFDKEKDLLNTTEELAFQKKVFNNTTIFDCQGKMYKIKNVSRDRYIGFFGLNPLIKNWWNDRQIKIKIEFGPDTEKINFKDLKKTVFEMVDKRKRFWSSSWNIEDFKKAIGKALTFKELIILFK